MIKFMQVCEWIYRLLFLNALWVLFSIGGLIIFGLFPSTASMFYITKEWLAGNTDIPIFKTFFTRFKLEFLRSHLLGGVVVVFGGFLYFNLQFFHQVNEPFFYIMRYLMVTVGFVYIMMLSFIFPLFVQERIKLGELLKYVLFISITRIFHSMMMVIGCLTIFVVFIKFAGVFIFFFGSAIAMWLTWNTSIAMRKIRVKRELLSFQK